MRDFTSVFVAYHNLVVAVDPGEGALDDPLMSAELLADLDARRAIRGAIRRRGQA